MWSIPQFVEYFDVSEQDMAKCIQIRSQTTDDKFDYDIELISDINTADKEIIKMANLAQAKK